MVLTRDLALYSEIVRRMDGIAQDKRIHPLLSSLELSTIGETDTKEENEYIEEIFNQLDDENKEKVQIICLIKHKGPTDQTAKITVASLSHKAHRKLSEVGEVTISKGRKARLVLKDPNFPYFENRMSCTNTGMFVLWFGMCLCFWCSFLFVCFICLFRLLFCCFEM